MKTDRRILAGAGVLALSLAAGGAAAMDKKFGAPTEGMSVEEYQSLVFLDPPEHGAHGLGRGAGHGRVLPHRQPG